MVRKMSPAQALEALRFTNKGAAKPLTKAIKTVLANAGKEMLVFKSLEINEGMKLKRMRAGSKGRAKPYKRRWSHIKIVLSDNLSEKVKVKNEKLPKAAEEKKEGK